MNIEEKHVIEFPEESGEYLFYFGKHRNPYYSVEKLVFVRDEDNYDKIIEIYLENNEIELVTMWWYLPHTMDLDNHNV